MAESEGEIEYLEEDEDIVQQCIQVTQTVSQASNLNLQNPPLLVERSQAEKKKKRKKEEDSDYDPSEDDAVLSPPSPEQVRKKKPPPKKIRVQQASESQKFTKSNCFYPMQKIINRKKVNIRIPDFDDPLCLPVRAIKDNESDIKRLKNWNNVCLEHFKHCDTMLKPERGETRASVRTAIFKNVVNKHTGADETTIWSKTSVQSMEGDKKSEIFQCILPRYKEKKVPKMYTLASKRNKLVRQVEEVVLSKENHKDGEALIVYKPKENLSAVYGLIDKRELSDTSDHDEDSKMYMKELTFTKMCAPCFQTSWRGVSKGKQKALVCPVCGRTYLTVYNLLSHFKTHSAMQIHKYRRVISSILAEMVGYHYNCRICRQKFDSIRSLRIHVKQHNNNTEKFTCEIGNHVVSVNKGK